MIGSPRYNFEDTNLSSMIVDEYNPADKHIKSPDMPVLEMTQTQINPEIEAKSVTDELYEYKIKYEILKQVFDHTSETLKAENEFLKQTLINFIPDKSYYNTIFSTLINQKPLMTSTDVENIVKTHIKPKLKMNKTHRQNNKSFLNDTPTETLKLNVSYLKIIFELK